MVRFQRTSLKEQHFEDIGNISQSFDELTPSLDAELPLRASPRTVSHRMEPIAE